MLSKNCLTFQSFVKKALITAGTGVLILTANPASSADCMKEADALVDCILTYQPHEFDPVFIKQLTKMTYEENGHHYLKDGLKINPSNWLIREHGWKTRVNIDDKDKKGKNNIKIRVTDEMEIESDLFRFCKEESMNALSCELF
ncbi:MAG: hypothetical protein ACL93V_01145 [Candidatus Electrothrix sp. YB6]